MRRVTALIAIIGVTFVMVWSGQSFAEGTQSASGDARAVLSVDVNIVCKVAMH